MLDEPREVLHSFRVVVRHGDRVLILNREVAVRLVPRIVLVAEVVLPMQVRPVVALERIPDLRRLAWKCEMVTEFGVELVELVLHRAPLGKHLRVVVHAPVGVIE